MLVQDICKLFQAYPEYHGDSRTIDIHALGKRGDMLEFIYGKNLKSVDRKVDSENIVTRLYVEGEYGDYGYVGIDDVNPTGLGFLFDFSYFKEIGLFTQAHQEALDLYLLRVLASKTKARELMAEIQKQESALSELWGPYSYVLFLLENGAVARSVPGGSATIEDAVFLPGDDLALLQQNGSLTYMEVGVDEPVFQSSVKAVIKRITLPAGIIGGKEVGVESKELTIQKLRKRWETETNTARREALEQQIRESEESILLLQHGETDKPGLFAQTHSAADLAVSTADLALLHKLAMAEQDDIEADLAIALGDMLRDGYWSDTNYTMGQEEFLYADALDMMAVVSRPAISYTTQIVNLAHVEGYELERLALNLTLRLYDPKLDLNDYVYVTKLEEYPANPAQDSITISNDILNIGGRTLESLLGRINEIANLIEQKNALYERAKSIGKDGSIQMQLLEGRIDVLKTQLHSSVSNWYTDANGNIVLEAVDGRSAMKLCGDGFMIAAGKDEDGHWDWRTFGTGEGFTADMIVAGFLSADRIEAQSITANKLAADVGASLDLSSNKSINLVVENSVGSAVESAVKDVVASYRVELIPSHGSVLSEYVQQTTLSARVWRGATEVTEELPAACFRWRRTSTDPTSDTIWDLNHRGKKSITVGKQDVYFSATYRCEIDI